MRSWTLRAAMTGALLLAALYPAAAAAQEVTSSNTGFGALRRGGDAAAEEQGRSDWPRITQGEDGTHVYVTFDPHNVDVVLMTPRDFGLSRLLEEGQRLAKAINRPEADFITFMGQKTVTVDVELNDYLQHPSRGRTEVELDLSALGVALKASQLPRPVVLHIDPDSADRAVISSASSAKNLRAGTILGLDEVSKGSVLRFESQIPWYAPIIAGGMAVMMVGAVAVSVWAPWRVARQRREQAELAASGRADDEADPAEVQKQYDKQPAIWRMAALFPILLLSTALFGDPRRVLESAFYVLPDFFTGPTMLFLPLGMVAGVGGSTLVCRLVERARARRDGHPLAPPPDPDAPPAWTQHWWFALLGLMMLVMMGMMTLLFSGLARPTWLVYIPYTALGVMLVGGVVGSWLSARAVRQTLSPGDRWHDLVQEIAATAGVQVKRVVRIQSTSVNACATAFGTVGLTSALLRKMDPDEIRAVIAHEVGHLRGGHARRNLVLTLGGSILMLALWWGLVSLAEGRISRSGLTILRGPIFSIFLLPILMNLILGKERRRHEEVADRFAVDVTEDPELVIRMLTRLHTLESSPHQLKRSDEAMSTHPSLVNRIAAIRSYAAEREGRSA